jgi:hypothetical protein
MRRRWVQAGWDRLRGEEYGSCHGRCPALQESATCVQPPLHFLVAWRLSEIRDHFGSKICVSRPTNWVGVLRDFIILSHGTTLPKKPHCRTINYLLLTIPKVPFYSRTLRRIINRLEGLQI